jgi:hypothetical protein
LYLHLFFTIKKVVVADTHAHVQGLISVVKMATVLKECTTGEQHSVVRFLRANRLNAKDIHKKCFLFTVGSVCHVQRLTIGSRNSLKGVRKSQMLPNQVQNWLRQQPKDFYAAGLDALVKRWDKCINIGGGCIKK